MSTISVINFKFSTLVKQLNAVPRLDFSFDRVTAAFQLPPEEAEEGHWAYGESLALIAIALVVAALVYVIVNAVIAVVQRCGKCKKGALDLSSSSLEPKKFRTWSVVCTLVFVCLALGAAFAGLVFNSSLQSSMEDGRGVVADTHGFLSRRLTTTQETQAGIATSFERLDEIVAEYPQLGPQEQLVRDTYSAVFEQMTLLSRTLEEAVWDQESLDADLKHLGTWGSASRLILLCALVILCVLVFTRMLVPLEKATFHTAMHSLVLILMFVLWSMAAVTLAVLCGVADACMSPNDVVRQVYQRGDASADVRDSVEYYIHCPEQASVNPLHNYVQQGMVEIESPQFLSAIEVLRDFAELYPSPDLQFVLNSAVWMQSTFEGFRSAVSCDFFLHKQYVQLTRSVCWVSDMSSNHASQLQGYALMVALFGFACLSLTFARCCVCKEAREDVDDRLAADSNLMNTSSTKEATTVQSEHNTSAVYSALPSGTDNTPPPPPSSIPAAAAPGAKWSLNNGVEGMPPGEPSVSSVDIPLPSIHASAPPPPPPAAAVVAMGQCLDTSVVVVDIKERTGNNGQQALPNLYD